MQLSKKAASLIKGNNKLIGRLMEAFDRGQKTIEDWAANCDVRLTTPTATQIISDVTGLSEEEILEKESVQEIAK